MQTLIGLGFLGLTVWGIIYFFIWLIKGGKKAIYHQVADRKKVEGALTRENQFVFRKNIYPELIFPSLWIAAISTLFFSTTDVTTAIFGVIFLTWFMAFRIYYSIRSRKDKVILDGNRVEFHYKVGTTIVNAADYAEANLEFRKMSSYNGAIVIRLLIFGPGSDKEIIITNAAFSQNPYEIVEALQRLNPHVKFRKLWNNTIRKKVETSDLRPAV